jgi:hypothetical protein
VQPNQVVPQEVIFPVHPINHPIKSEVNPVGTGIEEFADTEKIMPQEAAHQRQVATGKEHCIKFLTAG